MAKRGRIIALVTSKGGSGKTTMAAAIAGELLRRGESVTLVDADPLGVGGLTQWHKVGGDLTAAELVIDATEGAAAQAREASARGVVIVDVGGAWTRTTVAVLACADTVLIPCVPSALDAMRAAEVYSNAKQATRAAVGVVLNRVPRGSLGPHIRKELKSSGVHVLRSELSNRVAYVVAALYGSSPAFQGAKSAKAAGEVVALVNEMGRL